MATTAGFTQGTKSRFDYLWLIRRRCGAEAIRGATEHACTFSKSRSVLPNFEAGFGKAVS